MPFAGKEDAIDNRTIAMMTDLIGVVSSILLLVAALSEKDFGGVRRERKWPSAKMLWSAGVFLTSCGFGLISTQGSISPWLCVVAANTFIVMGWNLITSGLRTFVGYRAFPARMYIVGAATALGFAVLTFLYPSVSGRIALVSGFATLAFAECCVLALSSRRSVPGPMPRVSALLFLVLALFFFMRMIMAFATPVSSLFEPIPTIVTTLSLIVAAGTLVSIPISLILLRNASLLAELERGQALYRGIVENAGVGIYQSTWEGHSFQINAAGAALFGFESVAALLEAFGHSSLSLYADVKDRERFLAQISEKGHVEDFCVQSRRADGSLFWLSINATLVRGEGGTRILTGSLMDVSARIREEEELKRSRDEKAVRLRELQHRVKNGMSVIASLASLKAGQAGDDASRRSFEDLEREISALASLYDLLYRSGESMDVRLDEYLGSLIEALTTSHGASERGIEVRTSLEQLDTGLKRAESIGLATVELVADAFKHGFPKGRRGILLVALRREDDSGVLEIVDDGVGLPDSFSLASSGGYGLTMVDLLAQQLGGELEVGGAPEGGARFAMRFPLKSPRAQPSTSA
jgi:PAS domain S-box-containing protein